MMTRTAATPEPGTPEAAEAIRAAARRAVEALTALAPLIEPYNRYEPPPAIEGLDAEHFAAYHYDALVGAQGGYRNNSLVDAIRSDLLGLTTDGIDWFDASGDYAEEEG